MEINVLVNQAQIQYVKHARAPQMRGWFCNYCTLCRAVCLAETGKGYDDSRKPASAHLLVPGYRSLLEPVAGETVETLLQESLPRVSFCPGAGASGLLLGETYCCLPEHRASLKSRSPQ